MGSFGAAAASVNKLKDDIEDEVEDAVGDSMDDVAQSMRWKIEENDSDATGVLKSSIRALPERTPSSREIARISIIGAEHWKYVEYGTGVYTSPKRPFESPDVAPYQPIYRWIVASGITPRPSGDADNQAELAYAIQRSISKGTHSHPFVRPVWRGRNGKGHVQDSISRAVAKALASMG